MITLETKILVDPVPRPKGIDTHGEPVHDRAVVLTLLSSGASLRTVGKALALVTSRHPLLKEHVALIVVVSLLGKITITNGVEGPGVITKCYKSETLVDVVHHLTLKLDDGWKSS